MNIPSARAGAPKVARLLGGALALCAVALTTPACVHLPDDPEARALFVDFERIVATRERTEEWVVDRAEFSDMLPGALRSVCQTHPKVRADLIAWIDATLATQGGSAEAVYNAQTDKDLDEVRDMLRLERIRGLLRYADARAAEDCPFWLKAADPFTGVHANTDRFIVFLESNGGGWLVFQGDQLRYGGGGAGRLSAAWGFGDRLTVMLGAEVGGSGLISAENADDAQDQAAADALAARLNVGVPLVFRFHDASRVYDVEVAAVSLIDPRSRDAQFGVRALVGGGLETPRIGAIMPSAVFLVGYEFYPSTDLLPTTHMIRIGTRVGVGADL